jgi:hypothetical protein
MKLSEERLDCIAWKHAADIRMNVSPELWDELIECRIKRAGDNELATEVYARVRAILRDKEFADALYARVQAIL